VTSATVDGLGSMIYSMSGGMVSNSTAQNSGIIAGFGGTIANSTVNGGVMNAYSGTTLSNDSVANAGFIHVENGAKADNIIINQNGTLDIQAGGSVSSVNFAQSNGTMFMDLNAKVGTIYGFDTNNETDRIFITGVSYSSSDTVSLGKGNVLNVNFGGGDKLSLQLDPSFNYTGHNFYINNVGGDVVITDPISGLSEAGATPKFLAKSSVSLEAASNTSGGQANNGKSLTLISGISPKYFGAIDIASDMGKTNGSIGTILDNSNNYGAIAVIHNSTTQNSFGSITHALTHTATHNLPN